MFFKRVNVVLYNKIIIVLSFMFINLKLYTINMSTRNLLQIKSKKILIFKKYKK